MLNIVGAVFLLLWSIQLVRQGFTRVYGANLRRILAAGTKNRFLAFLSGLTITALIQSSIAATILTISFVKKNFLTPVSALAIILGADISTSVLAQILSFDLSWLSPILIIIGVSIYLSSQQKNIRRHLGRVAIGLGLMLLALSLVREATAPLQSSELLPIFLRPLQNDPFAAIIFSAILTWVMHSSLAAVLFFALLTGGGVIDVELGVMLVMGANLGGPLVPFTDTFAEGTKARRIALGNVIMRMVMIGIALAGLDYVMPVIRGLTADPARELLHFHTGFNIALAIFFLPIVPVVVWLTEKILPEEYVPDDGNKPLYLDEKAITVPALALAGAARETLRIAEIVEDMLIKMFRAIEFNDRDLIEETREADNQVDALYNSVKLYMTKLSSESLVAREADRYIQILTFSTNLEHIGDIIEKNLVPLAEKKIRRQEEFSKKGFEEIKGFHEKVLQNFKLSQSIFLSEDPELAAQMVAGKDDIRKAAESASHQHFRRLHEGVSEAIATSSLHLDIIRDYRQINSYATRVAYAILQARTGSPEPEKKPS